ncbi:MAG: hypothetical protein IPN01_21910 [Deltaproteobacteria bacterium]|nr:hypothetical protein [Deltaproteobacteria bacterium]
MIWADGVNERALLSLGSGADAWAPKVSPDGKNVLVMARPPNPGGDRAPTNLYVGPIGPTAEPLRALLPLETKTPTFLPINSAYKGVVASGLVAGQPAPRLRGGLCRRPPQGRHG